MRFSKAELLPLAVAMDTAISALELDPDKPVQPWPAKRERENALLFLRAVRSKALRSARDPAEPDTTDSPR